jgi:anti-sigma-K factor RskA
VLGLAAREAVALPEDDKEILRRVVLARLMDERLPAEDLGAARAIVDRCQARAAFVTRQPNSAAAPRHRGSRGSMWRAAARAAVAVIVSVACLASPSESTTDDLRHRTVATRELATKCVAMAAGHANHDAVESRVLVADANACPRSDVPAQEPI